MGEVGIPPLSYDQLERICEIAEEAARKHLMLKVPKNLISNFMITVETEEIGGVTISIDVEITLLSTLRNLDPEKLTKESVEAAFRSIERFLGEIKCQPER